MNARPAPATINTGVELETAVDPLDKLREPFPAHQISKLPKETGKQAEQRKAEQNNGNWPKRCTVCGGLHHANAVHLDYVGHAALTDRLLDTDLRWTWEPMAVTPEGLPAFDKNGGLWIKLTICGVTRIGYGSADGKSGGDAIKEVIGDALRNSGMRFGAALDLWHKGELHVEDTTDAPSSAADMAINLLKGCADASLFKEAWQKNFEGWRKVLSDADYKRVQTAKAEIVAQFIADAERAKVTEKPLDPNDPFSDEIPF